MTARQASCLVNGEHSVLLDVSDRGIHYGDGVFETMAVADVRCFVAGDKYVTACGPDRELLIPDTLKDLEQEFGERFLRVHRNALVALEHVLRLQRDEAGTWRVVLEGIEEHPAVSRRHLAQVKQRLVEG